MFGFVMANGRELSRDEKIRYSAVYCGICRNIRAVSGNLSRMGLSYDMAFLALLLMSLYEPQEETGNHACMLHPMRPFVDSEVIRYAADMNVALGYYNCMDDYQDEGKRTAKWMAGVFAPGLQEIKKRWPRQCEAIEHCIGQLGQLEKENCPDPDTLAGCFGGLMEALLCYRQDRWETDLRQMGNALGRFIYLADAATDYRKDKKKHRFNPFLAMGMEEDRGRWEDYLVLAIGRCCEFYEHLPLVQDKKLLDNILYSGIWIQYRRRMGAKA